MKFKLYLLAAVLALMAHPLDAATLPKKQIAADAKWLLHVDLQNLRQTKLGEFATKGVLEKAVAPLKSQVGIDVNGLVERVSSITAYGTDFQKNPEANGVLLVQMDAEAQKIVEGFLAAQMLADSKGAIKKSQQDGVALYSADNKLSLAIHPNHLVVVGKSQKQIDKATEVLAGKAQNLTASDAFSDFPALPNAYFFLAVAEGFNENSAIPPQAEVLRKADGARVLIGEATEKLFVDLALRARSLEVSQQIQQVIEGIRAMVSLSQIENKDLQELVRSINVSTKGKMVSVRAEFPVGPLIKKIENKVQMGHDAKERRAKTKGESEQKADSAAPSK